MNPKTRGFSLIELSIALLIITLLLGSGTMALSGQMSVRQHRQMQKDFENIKEALYGYALVNGKLPCVLDSNGHENCAVQYGYLPFATLGVAQKDVYGNAIRYFVHSAFSKEFTLTTGGKNDDAVRKTLPDIWDSANGNKIAVGVVAVFWTEGQSGKVYRSTDEQTNNENNLKFIYRAPSNDFDDEMQWLSPFVLKAKMLAAQKLP